MRKLFLPLVAVLALVFVSCDKGDDQVLDVASEVQVISLDSEDPFDFEGSSDDSAGRRVAIDGWVQYKTRTVRSNGNYLIYYGTKAKVGKKRLSVVVLAYKPNGSFSHYSVRYRDIKAQKQQADLPVRIAAINETILLVKAEAEAPAHIGSSHLHPLPFEKIGALDKNLDGWNDFHASAFIELGWIQGDFGGYKNVFSSPFDFFDGSGPGKFILALEGKVGGGTKYAWRAKYPHWVGIYPTFEQILNP